jgi:tetratricopeptide (TPR) repeat protein
VTYEITKITILNEIIDSIIFILSVVITLFICAFIILKIKLLNKFKIGLFFFLWSIIVFLIFYLNYNLTFKGEYNRYKLRWISQKEENSYLSIDYTIWANSTKVELDKCLNVDSVDVRIDRGIFGMKTFSDNIELIENNNCISSKQFETYEETGNYYSKKRCFNEAIQVYTEMISVYPIYHSSYFHRGQIFLVKKQYKKALKDFKIALKLLIDSIDKSKMNQIKKTNLDKNISNLLRKINTEKNVKIGNILEDSKIKYDLDLYVTLINYCKNKI